MNHAGAPVWSAAHGSTRNHRVVTDNGAAHPALHDDSRRPPMSERASAGYESPTPLTRLSVEMLYLAARKVVAPTLRAIWRPTIEGAHHVPRTGGVILASNHLSFVDSIAIPSCAPRQVHFLAKADYFTGTGPKGVATRTWMSAMGMIPVDRDDTRAAQKSLQAGLEVLRSGAAFGIYPEGTRSRDGRLYRGKTGVAYLALEADVPVVPVGLHGTQNIQPIGSNQFHRAPVTIKFGEPLSFRESCAGMPAGRARRAATDQIMAAIHALSGQELAGEYNEHPSTT